MALTEKTKAWIKANVDADLSDKTVLITGANSGVGFKTAKTMVYLGASVIMACRNMEKAAAARESLLADYPSADVRKRKLLTAEMVVRSLSLVLVMIDGKKIRIDSIYELSEELRFYKL